MENAFLALYVMQWFIWICFPQFYSCTAFSSVRRNERNCKAQERMFAHDILLLLFPKVNWKNGLWSSMAPLCSHTHPPMSSLKWNASGIAESKTRPTTTGRRIMQVSWLPGRRQAEERTHASFPQGDTLLLVLWSILIHLPFYPLNILHVYIHIFKYQCFFLQN